MTKAILMSIRPQHAVNILNGNKTLELRKTVPKDLLKYVKKYGGIWVHIYVTKKEGLYREPSGRYFINPYHEFYDGSETYLSGKVVARFWFDECDMYYFNEYQNEYRLISQDKNRFVSAIMGYDELCLTENQVNEYGKGKDLYAWHIKRLEIFDKPKELSDFVSDKLVIDVCGSEFKCYSETASYCARKDQRLTKAPQSYQYVYVKEQENE